MNGTNSSPLIAVTSDRSLVADAVGAALTGNGFAIVRIPWPSALPERAPGWPPGTDVPELGLIL